MHPLLLPGTHVLQRPDGRVQLGLDPTRSVTVEPGEASADGLAPRLGSPALREDPVLTRRLTRAGAALPDDAVLRAAMPADRPETRWQRHSVAALVRADPATAPARLAERSSKRVRVHGFGHPLDELLREDLLALLARAGLAPAGRDARRPTGPRAAHPEPVHVLLGVGEPRRDQLDPLMREAVPHLVVRLAEGRAVVGPFVLPGLSACLRCLDAARSEVEPAWPLLLEQYARAARQDRADGVPEPVDAVTAASAVAWAAREVATYAEGGTPATLHHTIVLEDRSDAVTRTRWAGHPRCGCSWTLARRAARVG